MRTSRIGWICILTALLIALAGFAMAEGNEGGAHSAALQISQSEITEYESAVMSVSAPGASWIRVFCEQLPHQDWAAVGDAWSESISLEPGYYTFYAEVCFDDGTVALTNTVSLNVTVAEKEGYLGEPSMWTDRSTITPGENLTVYYSFGEEIDTEGIEVAYGWAMYDERDRGEPIYEETLTKEGGSFQVVSELVANGHRYVVELYTWTDAPGYDAKSAELMILAIPDRTAPEDRDLSLTMDGSNEVWIQNNENHEISVHAPDATAIHLFMGHDDEDWEYWGDPNGLQEDLTYRWEHWTEGDFALWLEICYDPDFDNSDAWYLSEPLIIHVTMDADQPLNRPQYNIVSPVQIGSLMEITDISVDERAAFCWADVFAMNENGEIDWSVSLAHGDQGADGKIYLPTNRLEPNGKYIVSVTCRGYGWPQSKATDRVFTAAGKSMSGEAMFAAVKDHVDTGESLILVANVPEAYELRVYADGNPEDIWDQRGGDSMNCEGWQIWESGEHHFTLCARFTEDDVWEDVATIPIYVNAPHGEIPFAPPVEWNAGIDWELNFSEAEATWINAGMWKEEADGWDWHEETEESSLTIPGWALSEGVFHYSIDVHANGYERLYRDGVLIAVGENQDGDITLDVPNSVPCAENFTITAEAAGATAISVWIPNLGERFEPGSQLTWEEQIRWAGTAAVYVRICRDEIDWDSVDWNSFDWYRDVNWGPISSVRTISVISDGQAENPVVAITPGEPTWGDTLQISVSAAEHAAWYDVRIRRQENWEELYYAHLDEPRTVEISTSDLLDPGEYAVEVYVAGETGYAENGFAEPFTLASLGQCGESLLALGAKSISQGRFLEISIPQAADTEWYHLRVYDEDWNEVFFKECQEGTYMLSTLDLEAGREYAVVISTGAPGYDWNETSRENAARFTVTERGGDEAYLEFSKYEMEVHESFRNSIYVPNAIEISTTVNEPENWEIGDWDSVWQFGPWTGDSTDGWGLVFERIGNYTVKLYAKYSDEGEWVYTGVEKTLTAIGAAYDLRSLVPPVVQAGTDFEIALPVDEIVCGDGEIIEVKPSNSSADIWDDTTGEQIYWMNWDDSRDSNYDLYDSEAGWASEGRDGEPLHGDNGNIYVPAGYLKANHTYHINYSFGGRGIEAEGVGDVKFSVIGGTDEQVTLTVEVPEDRNLFIYEDYRIVAEAEGATAIRAYDGWNWHYAAGGRLEETWNDGNEGTRHMYAQAYYGDAAWTEEGFDWNEWDWHAWDWNACGFEWGGVSNIVDVTFEPWDLMEAPEIRVITENIVLGGFVEVEVLEPEDEAWYHGGIGWRQEDGSEYLDYGWYDMDENHIIRMPIRLSEAGEYLVFVEGGGLLGQNPNTTTAEISVTEAGAQINTDRDNARTGEDIWISLHVPGAYEMAVTVNEEEDGNWENTWVLIDSNGENYDGWQNFGTRDIYTLKLYAKYSEEDEWHWTEISKDLNIVSVTHDLRSLVLPVVQAGTDFEIALPVDKIVCGDGEIIEVKPRSSSATVYDDTIGESIYWMNWDDNRSSNYDLRDIETGWVSESRDGEPLHSDNGNICIPADYLKVNHTYYINYSFGGPGIEDDNVWDVKFSVISGTDEQVTLTVAIPEDRNLFINEDYRVVAEAEGATAIRAYDGWNWHYNTDGNRLEEIWNDGSEGTRHMYAQAYYGDAFWQEEGYDWSDWDLARSIPWGGVSDIVDVTFEAWGPMEAPEIQVISENIVLGGFVEVEVINPQEGIWYQGSLGWMDEAGNTYDYYGWVGMDEDHIIRIPVRSIESGDHLVLVECGGLMGYNPSRTFAAISVNGAGAQISMNKRAARTRENIWCNLYVPGATRLIVTVDEFEGWTWENIWTNGEWYGEFGDWNLQFEDSGFHTLSLYAKYTDDYDNEDWKKVTSQTIEVVSKRYDLRTLVLPVVQAGTDFEIALPVDEIVCGDGEIIEVKPSNSSADIWDDTTGEHIYWMNWDDSRDSNYDLYDSEAGWASEGRDGEPLHGDNGNIHVPAGYLKANHTYHIDYSFGGLGIEAESVWDVKFSVIGGEDEQVTLTVTIPEDRNLFINENYQVVAEAEGATAIRAYDGWNWHYAAGERLEETWNNGSEGTWHMYAQAYYGDAAWTEEGFDWNEWDWNAWDWNACGFEWGGVSNIVDVTFDSWGQMEAPEIQVITDNIVLGGFVEIEVLNPQDEAWYQGTLGWMDEAGNTYEYYSWVGMDADHIIRVPVHSIEAGSHLLLVECGGLMGYNSNRTFTEISVSDAGVQFNVDRINARTGEDIWISLHVPGAYEMAVTVNEEESWTGENAWVLIDNLGEYAVEWRSFDTRGTYTLKLYAKYSEEDEWHWVEVSRDLNIVSVTYDLRTRVPVVVQAGSDFEIELPVDLIECGDGEVIEVKPSNSSADIWDDTTGEHIYWMNWDDSRNSDYDLYNSETGWASGSGEALHRDNGNIYIPADYLKANHTYHIDYGFGGRGIDAENVWDVKFSVIGGTDGQVTLTVEVPEDRNLFVYEDYRIIAEAEGATAIRAYDGWSWHYAFGDRLEEFWSDGTEGTRHLYAQAYYGTAPWDEAGLSWEDWNWDNGNWDWNNCGFEWGGVSNIVGVTFDPWGYTGSFDFMNHDDIQARQGEVIRVTFDDSEHATNYWADAFDPYGCNYNPNCWSEGTTVYISTVNLPEGEYLIWGRAGADFGYNWSESDGSVKLTVTGGEPLGEIAFRTPGSLQVIEEEAFEGIAAQTAEITWDVTGIGRRAFAGSQLQQVVIHSNVETIGEEAFDSGVTVFGEFGSYAMRWALDHEYTYCELQ